MPTFSFINPRTGRPEKTGLISNIQPVVREDSVASSQTNRSKALPDAPLTFAQRWRHFWERPLLNTWLAEILALTFSAACLIAIIVVLRVYDSKTIPEIPFGLTLNAIVSILAAGSKSSLLLAVAGAISQLKWNWFTTQRRKLEDIQEFDDASRGPGGSLTLLFTINIRSLASIGALVTILTLAYDPFVQQVLIYPVRVIEQASNETATTQALVWVPDANTPEFGNALNAGTSSAKILRRISKTLNILGGDTRACEFMLWSDSGDAASFPRTAYDIIFPPFGIHTNIRQVYGQTRQPLPAILPVLPAIAIGRCSALWVGAASVKTSRIGLNLMTAPLTGSSRGTPADRR